MNYHTSLLFILFFNKIVKISYIKLSLILHPVIFDMKFKLFLILQSHEFEVKYLFYKLLIRRRKKWQIAC